MFRLLLISFLALSSPLLFFPELINNPNLLQNFIKSFSITIILIIGLALLLDRLQAGIQIKTKKAGKLNNFLYAFSTILLITIISICLQLQRHSLNSLPASPGLILLISAILSLVAFNYFKSRNRKLIIQSLSFCLYIFNLILFTLFLNVQDININPALILSSSLAAISTAYYFAALIIKADWNKLSDLDSRILGLFSSAGLSIFLLLPTLALLPVYYFAVTPLFYFTFKLAPLKGDKNFNFSNSAKVQDRVFYAFIVIIISLRISLSYF